MFQIAHHLYIENWFITDKQSIVLIIQLIDFL